VIQDYPNTRRLILQRDGRAHWQAVQVGWGGRDHANPLGDRTAQAYWSGKGTGIYLPTYLCHAVPVVARASVVTSRAPTVQISRVGDVRDLRDAALLQGRRQPEPGTWNLVPIMELPRPVQSTRSGGYKVVQVSMYIRLTRSS